MATNDNNSDDAPISLEAATSLARSNKEWDKVYQYVLLHPNDFFVILPGRRWGIVHQLLYHGNVDLFKRFLALFSADQINLHSKTNDNKTFLDIAAEKRTTHPAMYTYMEYLYAHDELVKEAKARNWRWVMDVLNRNRQLTNEKPPYSPYFLLHYVVESGDTSVLQELIDRYQLQVDVLNDQNETPLEMATRLKKYDMCSILQSKTTARAPSLPSKSQSSFELNLHQSDQQSTSHSLLSSSQDLSASRPPVLLPNSISSAPLPLGIGFENSSINTRQTSGNGNGNPVLFNLSSSPSSPQPMSTGTDPHMHTRKRIFSKNSSLDSHVPPAIISTSSNQQEMRNVVCPITGEIFEDPVIASDGYTYERSAILDWVSVYHISPKTAAPMNATFTDDIETRKIIKSMHK